VKIYVLIVPRLIPFREWTPTGVPFVLALLHVKGDTSQPGTDRGHGQGERLCRQALGARALCPCPVFVLGFRAGIVECQNRKGHPLPSCFLRQPRSKPMRPVDEKRREEPNESRPRAGIRAGSHSLFAPSAQLPSCVVHTPVYQESPTRQRGLIQPRWRVGLTNPPHWSGRSTTTNLRTIGAQYLVVDHELARVEQGPEHVLIEGHIASTHDRGRSRSWVEAMCPSIRTCSGPCSTRASS